MPPKKKLVTEYRWHRVPQYLRDRSDSTADDDLPPEDDGTISGSKTPTSAEVQQPQFKLRIGSISQPNLVKKPVTSDPVEIEPEGEVQVDPNKLHPHQGLFSKLLNLGPWTFNKEDAVETEVLDVVLNSVTKDVEEPVEKRRSTWVLVDDGSGSEDSEEEHEILHKKRKKSSLNYQEVVTINGEIPIEAVILPKDRARLDFNLFWKDVDTFLEEIPIFLSIEVRNWTALRGNGCRPWRVPTTIHSWWGEWGTFLSYFHSARYWISKYPSHLPGRYAWDSAISSHSSMEAYYKMRRRHKAPAHYSWSCEGLDKREEERNILWSYHGYSNTPSKLDFDVKVEWLPGAERLSSRSLLCSILSQPGFAAKLSAAAYYVAWGLRRIPIHHYTDSPALGGAFTEALELPWVTLHNCFPELKELLQENVEPLEWQVYRHCIEDDTGIDPDLDVVHAYTNYDVRGGEGVKEYYDGQQYIICDRFQEDFDQPSGDWWYFPRNYRYEMQRGIGHIQDNYNRTRSPLYERMIELSSVGHASDPKPPWRKGSFQNLGWFLDQFQFHFLPFLRRTKVALDLVTRPFSYRETSLSRLDGTLFLLSRSCRILSKKRDFSPESWRQFQSLVDVSGEVLQNKMSALLSSLKPILKLFRLLNDRLSWASTQLEPAQSHWRILVGRSYYILGIFRFNFLHGAFYNRHFKDRYYGVPGLYSTSRHRRQLDPYNSYWLEQWPLKVKRSREPRGPDFIPGSETPPKPSFVPWDDSEAVERIPWNLIWLGDQQMHLQSPLEQRTVPLRSLGAKEKIAVFKGLAQNAEDILELAKDELDGGIGAIYKYKDDKEIVFMSPTGPVGPKDIGYENLLRLMTNPNRVNPLDTTPLQPFDTLLSQWFTIIGAAAERKFRHMLGPGAYRLSQSLEQVFDLHQEVHLLLPHLERMSSYLKSNLRTVRDLGGCQNRAEVLWTLLRHPGILNSSLLSPKPFYVVRFSVGPEENRQIGRGIPEDEPDSGDKVEEALQGFYYIKNQRYEGYVNARGHRKRVSRARMRLRIDRHMARTVGVDMEQDFKYLKKDNPLLSGGGVRRYSSTDLFYLEDDRPERIARYEVGKKYKKKDKMSG